MNVNPVIAAETASDLRQDVFKTGIALCLFMPICSLLASFFLSTYSAQSGISGEALTEAFIKSEYFSIYTLAVSLIPMLACIILLFLLYRRGFSFLMIKPAVNTKKFSAFTAAGLAAIPIGTLFSALTQIIMQELNLNISPIDAPKGAFATIIFIIAHVILAPILEELFFRGLILERLRRYGDLFAILASSMMFSLLHSSLQSFPSAFICGIVFALLAIWTGSFLSPTIIHAINNALSVATILLSANGYEAASNLVFMSFLMLFTAISAACIFIISKKGKENFLLYFSGKIVRATNKAAILFSSFSMIIFIFLSIASAISAAI